MIRLTLPSTLLLTLILQSCASNAIDEQFGHLDLSATRTVSSASLGTSMQMTAEIVYVEDLLSGDVLYRYDVIERRQVDIEQEVFTVIPGRYRVGAVCTDSRFSNRMVGLNKLDLKNERDWWAVMATGSGSTALLPATVLDVTLNGGERITPVNMSASGAKGCAPVYGDKPLNRTPEADLSESEYKAEFGDKIRLYN